MPCHLIRSREGSRPARAALCMLAKANGGTVLIELAMILMFFMIMISGTIDIGRALNQYLIASRSAYEGARYAATLRDLPNICVGTNAFCNNAPSGPIGQAVLVQNRIRRVLDNHDLTAGPGSQINFRIQMEGTSPTRYRTIQVQVQVPFRAMFTMFPITSVSANVASSDLFPDLA